MDPQIKRGLLDMCILSMLSQEASYGYKIVQDAPDALELSESTLYPILRRLSKQGFIKERRQEHAGRVRKYYAITDAGIRHLRAFSADRAQIEQVLSFICERSNS